MSKSHIFQTYPTEEDLPMREYEKRFGMASMLTPALDFIVFPQMQHKYRGRKTGMRYLCRANVKCFGRQSMAAWMKDAVKGFTTKKNGMAASVICFVSRRRSHGLKGGNLHKTLVEEQERWCARYKCVLLREESSKNVLSLHGLSAINRFMKSKAWRNWLSCQSYWWGRYLYRLKTSQGLLEGRWRLILNLVYSTFISRASRTIWVQNIW